MQQLELESEIGDVLGLGLRFSRFISVPQFPDLESG